MKNVFVIIGEGWTRQDIIKVIKDEGYKDNFYFGQNSNIDESKKEMKKAEECWCFGKCSDLELFKYAQENGEDIWIMGE